MSDSIDNIVSKLGSDELGFLKDKFGIELRNRQLVELHLELRAAALELEKIEKRNRIKSVAAAVPHCAFCEQGAHSAGPMAQSSGGALICRACALRCIAIIDAEAKNA